MFDRECKSLTNHIEAKKAVGLVDIKFYVNRFEGIPDPQVVCDEAGELFDAIAKGLTEPYKFNDRHAPAA